MTHGTQKDGANPVEHPPARGSAGYMYEMKLCLIGLSGAGGGFTARHFTLRHYFPDERIPTIVRRILKRERPVPDFDMAEDRPPRGRGGSALDIHLSRGVPTKVVYYLDLPNWYFMEQDEDAGAHPLTLRTADGHGQFNGLRAVVRQGDGIKGIRVQDTNIAGGAHALNLNCRVVQRAGGKTLSTIMKLHPRIINNA